MLETLRAPYVSLFIILFFGVLISKIEIKKIGLGSSSIVLSAIFFGYFGMKAPDSIEKIGLILFIFAVGIQAGPGFFESFKTGEARDYLRNTAITLSLVFFVTLGISHLMGFDTLLVAGLFSGVTTSTPALAAIIENGKSSIPLATYTVSYPVALVTTVFTIRILSKFMKINVELEENRYRELYKGGEIVQTAHYLVDNPNVFNKSLSDIHFNETTNAIISRIQRFEGGESFIPDRNTILLEKDLVKVIGEVSSNRIVSVILGSSTAERIIVPTEEKLISVLITNPRVVGKSLLRLNLDGLWGAEVREIRRAGVNIVPRGLTRLRFGDKILASVQRDSIPNFIKMLGGKESESIDFLPISIAIVLGVLIGKLSIPIGQNNIGPGMTGGILLTTLVLGRVGKTGPMLWSIAGRTNQFLREIGIMLFLCGVGSSTGEGLLKSLTVEGLKTILATILITVFSIMITAIVSVKLLKMNKLRFLGALAGSFTCAAALPSSSEVNDSSIPLTAYSVTYPFSLFLTIFIGQLILLL